jgi:hypothetical protein
MVSGAGDGVCRLDNTGSVDVPTLLTRKKLAGVSVAVVPAPFDDHFPNILSTSSRDGLQCGPAMFPFSWFHHQSRLQANFAAQGAGTGSDRNKASWLTRSLLSLIMTSPGIR